MTASTKQLTARRKWTVEEIELLQALYPVSRTADLAEKLGIKLSLVHAKAFRLGLRKAPEFQASDKSGRIFKGAQFGKQTQFQAGQQPWNKGRKGWQAGGRSAETQFTTGMMPPNTVPVGSLRIVNSRGLNQLERKIGTASGPNHMRWKSVHRLVWEAANGPTPHGHIVVFKPGMKTVVEHEITIDKVECISRAENAKRNHPRNKSPELAALCQLKGAITRQVNRITQAHQQATT